jgi:hypothetical protein
MATLFSGKGKEKATGTSAASKTAGKQSAASMMFFMPAKDKAKKLAAAEAATAAAAAAVAAATPYPVSSSASEGATVASAFSSSAGGGAKKKKKASLFMTPAERAEEKEKVQMEKAQSKLKERLEENTAWSDTLKATFGDRVAPEFSRAVSSSSASNRKLIEGPPAPYPQDFEQHVRQFGDGDGDDDGGGAADATDGTNAVAEPAGIKLRQRPQRAASTPAGSVQLLTRDAPEPANSAATEGGESAATDPATLSGAAGRLYKRHYERCRETPVGVDGASSLWCDRYRPLRAEDMIGNAVAVGQLRGWMDEWKQRARRSQDREKKARSGSVKKRAKTSRSSSGRPQAMKVDSDDDFIVPDDDSDYSEDEENTLSNTYLLTGPSGTVRFVGWGLVCACAFLMDVVWCCPPNMVSDPPFCIHCV